MATGDTDRSPSAVPTTETDQTGAQVKQEAQEEATTVTDEEWRAMQSILNHIYAYRDSDDHDPSKVFHRKVNKRALPEYYDVIKEPMALSTVKANINNKAYKKFSEFVRDFALISHNAQLYNRPEAGAYQDALVIKSIVIAELQKLVDQNLISAETATLPDLGEIPPPSPRAEDDEGDEEEEDEDEDEEDEGEDSEEEGVKRRRRRGPRSTAAITKREGGGKGEDNSKSNDQDPRKKRGRPPRVDTPLEARIKAVLKGLRKFKGPGGELKVSHFEKLPDKTLYPGYFTEIKNPMALDLIKRKAKRKKYQSVDQLMRDVELMFENAKVYNRDDSQIYQDAIDLQYEARTLAEQEKTKPDSDYMMEDGKLPLPNGILHNGQLWRVGDWVHIQNPNDLTKPIVAQIYRTWQDAEGQKWVNACWYYRPEQTVHRFERHFYEREVVKTGQYRDHNIEEVVDRCFVMFFTRFNKGRPRGFPLDKDVYVCESRYNEEKYKLNKIKTWASCLPDEVRERDYEMDLFDAPRRMKKVPSPIKHLLPADAKETGDLPKPTWGAENAPPVVGAVHKRPRESNESPPPEPSPSPPPVTAPPPQVRQTPSLAPQISNGSMSGGVGRPNSAMRGVASQSPVRETMMARAGSQNRAAYNQYQYPPQARPFNPSPSPAAFSYPRGPSESRQPSYSSQTAQAFSPSQQTGHRPNQLPQSPHHHHQQQQSYGISGNSTAHTPGYGYHQYPASAVEPGGSTGMGTGTGSFYEPPRPVEVYHLSESMQASIPEEIRKRFRTDDHGRILFFTTPPLHPSQTMGIAGEQAKLRHSEKYLVDREKRRQLIAKRDAEREEEERANKRNKTTRTTISQEEEDAKMHEGMNTLHVLAKRMLGDFAESVFKDILSVAGGDEGKGKK